MLCLSFSLLEVLRIWPRLSRSYKQEHRIIGGGARILKAMGPAGIQRKLGDSGAGCLGQTQQQEVKCTLRGKTGHKTKYGS